MNSERSKVKQCSRAGAAGISSDAKNQFPEEQNPLKAALIKLLKERVPGDPKKRTYAELIAQSIVSKATKGDMRAAQLVREGTHQFAVEFQNPRTSPVNVPNENDEDTAKVVRMPQVVATQEGRHAFAKRT